MFFWVGGFRRILIFVFQGVLGIVVDGGSRFFFVFLEVFLKGFLRVLLLSWGDVFFFFFPSSFLCF